MGRWIVISPHLTAAIAADQEFKQVTVVRQSEWSVGRSAWRRTPGEMARAQRLMGPEEERGNGLDVPIGPVRHDAAGTRRRPCRKLKGRVRLATVSPHEAGPWLTSGTIAAVCRESAALPAALGQLFCLHGHCVSDV